jgi:hypothetical protein
VTGDDEQQPHRPPVRSANRYAAFREITAPPLPTEETGSRKDLFSMTINAASEKGEPMDEQKFLIDLVFKPIEPGLKLRPEETQLILSYIGEILKELEAEENAARNEENALCK